MLLYIRPSFAPFFQKKYKQFLRKADTTVTKKELIKFQENLEFQIKLNTHIIAAKHTNICKLSPIFIKPNVHENLIILGGFIKRNRYEIFDDLGKIYSWQEFYNLFNIK